MDSSDHDLRKIVSGAMAAWRAGIPPDAQRVSEDNPALKQSKSLLLDLAYEEYCLRSEHDETIDNETFCDRFPEIRSSLFRQLEVHRHLIQGVLAEAPDTSPEPGDEYLGFLIEEELGRGTFSRVFVARQPDVGGRQVVLKVALGNAHEAHALGRLEHPNIMPIFSTTCDDASGATVVCMPFMGRRTLRDLIDAAFCDGTMPEKLPVVAALGGGHGVAPSLFRKSYVEVVAAIGEQIAEALSYSHSRDVIHGDLKPSNVLITDTGKPMLLDFNLAAHENSLIIGGTLPYMSPEHAHAVFVGGPDEIDERCDIFSFGVLLYELLTGKLPFGEYDRSPSLADTLKRWRKQQQEKFVSLGIANPAIDRRLVNLVDSCLALQRDERPSSMREVADCLHHRVLLFPRSAAFARKHRFALGAGLTVSAFLCTAGTAYIRSLPSAIERQLRLGKQSLQEGEYEAALKNFQLATSDSEPTAELLQLQGKARLGIGDYRAASMDFAKAAEMDAKGVYFAELAYCLCQLGYAQAAVVESQAAIDAGYQTPAVYNNLGRAYFQWNPPNGHHSLESWQAFSRAVEQDPTKLEPRLGRALLAIRCAQTDLDLGFASQAVVDMQMAVKLSPPNANHYFIAAMVLSIAAKEDPHFVTEALNYLELAVENGMSPSAAQWNKMEIFAPLASEPRFERLLAKTTSPKADSSMPLEFVIAPD